MSVKFIWLAYHESSEEEEDIFPSEDEVRRRILRREKEEFFEVGARPSILKFRLLLFLKFCC